MIPAARFDCASKRPGIGPAVAVIIVVLIICASGLGIVGMQTFGPGGIAGTKTLVQTTTTTITVTGSQQSGSLENSAQIAVTGTNFPVGDFSSAGSTLTFICVSSPSDPRLGMTYAGAAVLGLTNTGTNAASVDSVSITWAGANTEYTLSGTCNIGAAGSGTATTYLGFPTTTRISPSAIAGQTFTGT